MKPSHSQNISALEQQPRFVDRRRGAQFLSERFFPVSHRTLESWPLAWRHVNGHAVCELAELVAVAEAKLAAAAPIRGGRLARSPSLKIDSAT
jgi:hypothetical protein